MAADVGSAQASTQIAESIGNTIHPQEKAKSAGPKKPRRQRPNYHEIHAKPLPLDVYPLPAFVPHNPISIVRIAINLISHSLFPPQSHSVVHKAYFSPETQSIHVTDPASIRALWEQGFWGTGSLSRSEPQWLAGEKKRRGVEENRTSAEATQSRREERKQFKLERARAQREAIEQQLRQEGKLDADRSIDDLVEDGDVSESPKGTLYVSEYGNFADEKGNAVSPGIGQIPTNARPALEAIDIEAAPKEIQDQEHLQLTPEEAFYLTYTLGALQIIGDGNEQQVSPSHSPYPAWYLLRLYSAHANTSVREDAIPHLQAAFQLRERPGSGTPYVEPDNAFVLRYVVYHHFRSLGWVVRSGIKFAVDYLLYLRGPAFHHAEFAIMIIPSYSDPYWTETLNNVSKFDERQKELAKKDWWWLHRVNRVQTSVFKTLVLVYVEIPPPWDENYTQDGWKVDIGSVLKKYTVREVVIRRWSPNRNRD